MLFTKTGFRVAIKTKLSAPLLSVIVTIESVAFANMNASVNVANKLPSLVFKY